MWFLVVTMLSTMVEAGQYGALIKKAKKSGLTGYDLIDALDVWYGSNSPDYTGPWQQLDELGNTDRQVTLSDWQAAGLPKEHFEYFDKDGSGDMNIHEAHSWHQQRQPARTMDLSEVDNPPKGHLQPLGAHREPLPSEDLIYRKPYPHPRDFWHKHMDGYLPAVLKGAQDGWPAMGWTREVLKERFGWVDAKLEPKIEARGNNTGYADLDANAPSHRLNISEYIRIEKGKNMYVVSIIPQEMAWEVAHPSVFLCGSRSRILNRRTKPPYKVMAHNYQNEMKYQWMTHIFEANLWMASGKTRSQLHYDKEWNVNCLLRGRKRWFFLDPFQYDEDLQWSRGRKFRRTNPLNNAWTDWVYLDADRVDLIVQHKLRNMDYYELIQEAGDCIFIPYAMLHQATKLGDDDELQVAASWMFLPETIYEEDVCAGAPLDEDLPLAAMDTLYMYTGKGIIPQGYADPLNFIEKVEAFMRKRGETHLSLKTFTESVTQGDAVLSRIRGKNKKIKAIYDMLSAYAQVPQEGLRRDELRSVPLRLWCKPAAEGDDEGPLPCDHGQEYMLCDDKEFAKMSSYIQKRLAAQTTTSAPAVVPLPGNAETKNRRVYPKRPKGSRTEL